MSNLLAAHLVGNDERQPVAAPDRHQRQGEARVSGGSLDDAPARLQRAAALRRVDHGDRDAVLDRARGVLAFQLHEQPARPGVEALQLDNWGIADKSQKIRVLSHDIQ